MNCSSEYFIYTVSWTTQNPPEKKNESFKFLQFSAEMGMGQMRPLALPPQQQSAQPPQGTPQPPHSGSSMGSAGQFAFRQGPVPPATIHHDPNTFPMPTITQDPELFLAGIFVFVFETDKLFQDRLDRDNLEFMVRVSYSINEIIIKIFFTVFSIF